MQPGELELLLWLTAADLQDFEAVLPGVQREVCEQHALPSAGVAEQHKYLPGSCGKIRQSPQPCYFRVPADQAGTLAAADLGSGGHPTSRLLTRHEDWLAQ